MTFITVLLALADDGVTSLWRHAYHIPVVIAALVYGGPGVLVALAAILLYAPFVIPTLERSGPSAQVLEGLVTVVLLLGSGGLSAALAIGVRRQRRRFETLVAVQRSLEGEAPLAVALVRLRACLASRLDADVGLAIHDGAGVAVAGGAEVGRRSAVAHVLATGETLFVTDAGGVTRPRRCFVTPIGAGEHLIGALAIERAGDIGPDERGALRTLAAHLALALENARLAARQRRFAEELAEKVTAA